MLYQTIDNASQFRDQFHQCGRADQFSYEALGLIFDYLSDCGSDVELDVIAICCDYSAEHYTAIASNYSIDLDGLDDDEAKSAVVEYIQDNSAYLGEATDGELVYQCF
jgi:hypothetical protein